MIEYRTQRIESRDKSSRTVEGYAALFNSESRDLGFFEHIAPGAITEETILVSDIFATLDHNPEKIFARSDHGKGSLALSVDSRGLHYRFDAPKNDLGDTLLEHLDRGEISESSFAFTVDDDEWVDKDGVMYRTIKHIAQLYDVACCFRGAYAGTDVAHRNMPSDYEEKIQSVKNSMEEDKKQIEELEEEPKQSDEQVRACEEPAKEEPEKIEEKSEEESKEEPKEEPKEESEDEPKKEPEDAPKEEERNTQNISIDKKMETKRYSLVEEIRNAANSANPSTINLTEKRSFTVADEGGDVVATELFNALQALRDKSIIKELGAHYITGLDKKVQIPVLSGSTCKWKGEVETAEDGSGSFSHVTLEPHRLTAKVPISLELLYMDSTNTEEIIREDIVRAVAEKMQQSMFDSTHDTAGNRPDGLFYNVTPTTISTYGDLCNFEAGLEEKNINGDKRYALSPKLRAYLRQLAKNANKGYLGLVLEGNMVDGTPASTSNSVPAKSGVYGDFSQLYVATFGNMTLDVVRDSAYLANGEICLIINFYCDWKLARTNALAFCNIA